MAITSKRVIAREHVMDVIGELIDDLVPSTGTQEVEHAGGPPPHERVIHRRNLAAAVSLGC